MKQRTFSGGIVAMTVFGLAVLLPTSLKADSAEGLDFAALQADAIKGVSGRNDSVCKKLLRGVSRGEKEKGRNQLPSRAQKASRHDVQQTLEAGPS